MSCRIIFTYDSYISIFLELECNKQLEEFEQEEQYSKLFQPSKTIGVGDDQ